MIKATKQNKKVLHDHAREALLDYSPVMTWLVVDNNGDLSILSEPQGQTDYVGSDHVIATTGSFHKAHGDGAATDDSGSKYTTQRSYLYNLLGSDIYSKIFGAK